MCIRDRLRAGITSVALLLREDLAPNYIVFIVLRDIIGKLVGLFRAIEERVVTHDNRRLRTVRYEIDEEAARWKQIFKAGSNQQSEDGNQDCDSTSSSELDKGNTDEHIEDWRNDPDDFDRNEMIRDASVLR